jgi:2-oxo-3-hexenedioate decarboxylase/2-keto-4-pentenoate hydratase
MTNYDIEIVEDAVSTIMAKIELVEDYYIDYPSFPTQILIADDVFNTGVFLGAKHSNWKTILLMEIKGQMQVYGK